MTVQSGVITDETLGDVLRSISQRRRQGVLEINAPNAVIRIQFSLGKIIEVIIGDENPLDEIVGRLATAEVIPSGFVVSSEENYSDLFVSLMNFGPSLLDEDVFGRAVKHRILDTLYMLELGLGALYSFKVEIVEGDKQFSPSLSVGQILLDIVALHSEDEEFDSIFPPNFSVVPIERAPANLSDDEHLLMTLLEDGPLSTRKLRERSLLSLFHFREALLSLKTAGCVDRGEDLLEKALGGLGELETHDGAVLAGEISLSRDDSALEAVDLYVEAPGKGVPTRSAKTKLTALSVSLMSSSWIITTVTLCFVVASVIAPWFLWSATFQAFTKN